jgi:hypothetical protein
MHKKRDLDISIGHAVSGIDRIRSARPIQKVVDELGFDAICLKNRQIGGKAL